MYLPDMAAFGKVLLVWTGPERLAPSSCEELAWSAPGTAVIRPSQGVPGLLGRTASSHDAQCPKCACTAPSCALPSGVTAFSGSTCSSGAAGVQTPFSPPPGWDGSCVSPGLVVPEQFASFSIGPAGEVPCEPQVEEPAPPGDGAQDEVAIGCGSEMVDDVCALDNQICLLYQPRKYLPEPWRQCIVVEGGDRPCEAPAAEGDPWPRFSEKLPGFYRPSNGTRACKPCTCKMTEPSRCEALVSVYEDRACSDRLAEVTTAAGGFCIAPDPDSALGSLSATWLVNEPGRCTPEGGALERDEPITICCLPRGDG